MRNSRPVPPHYSGPGEEAARIVRPPFAYPRREPPRFNDPDETEGRRLYRALANAEGRMAMALARRVKLKSASEALTGAK
jgi:hypothetical protein